MFVFLDYIIGSVSGILADDKVLFTYSKRESRKQRRNKYKYEEEEEEEEVVVKSNDEGGGGREEWANDQLGNKRKGKQVEGKQ